MKESYTPTGFLKQITIGILLLNLIVIVIVGISINQSQLQYEDRANVTTQNLTKVLVEYISGIINKTDVSLQSVIDEARRQRAGSGLNKKAIDMYMLRQCKRIPELTGMAMSNAKGELVYGTSIVPGSHISVSDRDYFIHLRNDSQSGFFISEPVVSRVSGKWTIIISRRLEQPNGSFSGVVFGAIRLEDFAYKMFSKIDVGKQGSISLFDNDLRVVCRYPEPQGIGTKFKSAALTELFKRKQTSATYRARATLDGVERTFSYCKVSDYPLYVIVGLARDDYLAEWRNNVAKVLGIVAFLILLTNIFAWLIYRYFTEHKRIEETLQRSRDELELRVRERTSELKIAHDQLHNLATHLQSVREEERMNIARNIHDELGQMLLALNMDLSWFRDKYGDHKPIFDKVALMLSTLRAIIQSVKRICTELRPSILDDFGLVDSLQWQASEFQKRTGVECVVESAPENIEMDKDQSTALFRIFQEALTNVFKHAKATKVTAMLTKDDENIILEVIDNGIGITDEQLSKPQSFGLMGMNERVYPWRGKVEIKGYQNQGTAVKITIPNSDK